MPSPVIPRRSLSDSNIVEADHHSVKRSSKSDGSPLTAWSKKVTDLIPKRSTTGGSKSGLTEETVEELNRRNVVIRFLEDKRNSTSSPYYKGLTDFTLALNRERISDDSNSDLAAVILEEISRRNPTISPYYKGLTDFTLALNRERLPLPDDKNSDLAAAILEEITRRNPTISPYYKGLTDFTLDINRARDPFQADSSPGRESHVTSSSSKSSLAHKMQEWGASCFFSRNKEEKTSVSAKTRRGSTMMLEEKLDFEHKDANKNLLAMDAIHMLNKGKPLREIFSVPVPVHTSPTKDQAVVSIKKERLDEFEEVKRFKWADNYRPKALKDFICNREKAIELQNLVKSDDCCHYIFEGPPGVGKRTMIWALLREAFGAERVQAREECKEFNLTGEAVKSIHVNVMESSQHVEVNLSEMKGYEKQVIVELIRETNKRLSGKALRCSHDNCRAIILNEADKLSTDALLYIRWLLDRYKGCNKVFFCCSDISKLQPLKSICTVVHLLKPSNQEILQVLEFIAAQEGIDLPQQLAERIATNSKSNLRQAIRSFEATWLSSSTSALKDDQVIMTGWEEDIASIAKSIIEEQSPKQLYNIRGKLQKLIEHSVSPEFIFLTLKMELEKFLDEGLQIRLDKLYNEYNMVEDHQNPYAYSRTRREEMSKRRDDPLKKNVQHFLRIEEFIAKFMSCYKCEIASKKEVQREDDDANSRAKLLTVNDDEASSGYKLLTENSDAASSGSELPALE